ncbi:MAG: hypothetical protein F2842_00045 [Actinobacteria bacterium]|nr:hypothetical protein [Actinomycetota bacterium]
MAAVLIAGLVVAAGPTSAVSVAPMLAPASVDNSQTLEIYLPPGSLTVSVVGSAGFAGGSAPAVPIDTSPPTQADARGVVGYRFNVPDGQASGTYYATITGGGTGTRTVAPRLDALVDGNGVFTSEGVSVAPGNPLTLLTSGFLPDEPITFTISASLPALPGRSAAASFVVPSQVGARALLGSISRADTTDSTDSTGYVPMGSPTMGSDGTHFVSTGALSPLRISDGRGGDIGWNATVQASDLVPCAAYSPTATYYDGVTPTSLSQVPACSSPTSLSPAATAYQVDTISAANLGLNISFMAPADTPLLSGVLAQPAIQPANVLPGATPPDGLGLAQSRSLAHGKSAAEGGGSVGTVFVVGTVSLNIPTVTRAGSYGTTLTVTVI